MEFVTYIDDWVFKLINSSLSNGLFDAIFIPLRNKLFWIPIYLLIIGYLIKTLGGSSWLIIVCLIATVGLTDVISSHVIKKNVQRQRPCHELRLQPQIKVPCTHGYSFTSSHAANHFALSTFLFLFLAQWKYRWILFAWSSIICFAQIYVGVHYPSDVLAGAGLGTLLAYLAYRLFIKFNYLTKSIKSKANV